MKYFEILKPTILDFAGASRSRSAKESGSRPITASDLKVGSLNVEGEVHGVLTGAGEDLLQTLLFGPEKLEAGDARAEPLVQEIVGHAEVFSPGAVWTGASIDLLRRAARLLTELQERCDCFEISKDSSSELHNEAVRAIAGLAGERLKPCDPRCCPGHFGERASLLYDLGLGNYEILVKTRKGGQQ